MTKRGAALRCLVVAAAIATSCRANDDGPRGALAASSSAAPSLSARTYPDALKRGPDGPTGATVDLYLPAHQDETPPLLVYVEVAGPSDQGTRPSAGPDLGAAMQRRGVATAFVSVALGRAYRLTRAKADVAELLEELASRAERTGYDRARIALGGHDLGAWIVAALALDPRGAWGPGVGKMGAVTLGGFFDLSDEALADAEERKRLDEAFGNARARADGSLRARAGARFLALSAADGPAKRAQAGRAFVRSLEAAGAKDVASHLVPRRDANTLARFGRGADDLCDLVAWFATGEPEPLSVDGPWGVRQRWSVRPPLANDVFWKDRALVKKRPVDARFVRALERLFSTAAYELRQWPGNHYYAIDLKTYLAAQPAEIVGTGDHLVTKNIRGEQLYLSRRDIEAHRPVIVIGLDDEMNLFRIVTRYRLEQEYSWRKQAERPPMMVRPLGAFLHFPEAPPDRLKNITDAAFGLTDKSFRRVVKDPLAAARNLPRAVRDVLIGEEGCLTCHGLGEATARAHHVRAVDGKPHGGYALPLTEYPEGVLRGFLFEQEAVAKSFGVSPLEVDREAAEALFDLVATERRNTGERAQ